MGLKILFSKDFLSRTFGDVSQSLNGADCNAFRKTLKESSALLIPNKVFNSKYVDKLFSKIDGTEIKRDSFGNFSEETPHNKNSKIEQQELIDWVKMNYEIFTKKKISDDELKNMKMSKFMIIVDEMLKNGYEL